MIRQFFLLTIRNIARSFGYFSINLVGLSAGVASVILIFLWVSDEFNKDKFHSPNLFQVMTNIHYSDKVATTPSTSLLLANALKEEFPEVKFGVTTTWPNKFNLSVGDTIVTGNGFFASSEFFSVFNFPLEYGNADLSLKDKSGVVISANLALKLFGTKDNLIGKIIKVDQNTYYTITGVLKSIPRSSSLQFDILLPFAKYRENNQWAEQWQSTSFPTYVLLRENSDLTLFTKKLENFLDSKMESNMSLMAVQFSSLYLNGKFDNGIQTRGRIEYVELFSIVAGIIMMIACINFINLSTARATRKAKDVGIRKAVGAQRISLIFQYLADSMIITTISIFGAVLLVFLFMPLFNGVTGKRLLFNLLDPGILFFLFGLTVVIGLLAGTYPALYLSGFQPVEVLKGNVAGSFREFLIRRGLVVFQFAVSVLLIAAVIVVYQQISFVQNKNLGYNKEQLLKIPIQGEIKKSLTSFLEELKRIKGVKNASAVAHDITGQQFNTDGLEWSGKSPDENIQFEGLRGTEGLIETLDVKLIEGRTFTAAVSDSSKIILNETAVLSMGLDKPIGQTVKLWGEPFEIIGVVNDFHFESLHEAVKPMFFKLEPESAWNLLIRVEAANDKVTLAAIEKLYKSVNPGFIFQYSFQDDNYNRLYQSEQRLAKLAIYFSVMAIIISCLGLLGLVVFTIEMRIKEIGIRKVMGSSAYGIVVLLTRDFSKLVVVAIIIALPISYWLLNNWLQRFAIHIELSWIYFFIAGALTLIIAWGTLGWQAIKAASVNPVNCLKEL